MSYQVQTTGKFEKALKKCIKRGLNIQHFKDVLDELQPMAKSQTNIVLINFPGSSNMLGNVILSLIGFSFGSRMTPNSFFY